MSVIPWVACNPCRERATEAGVEAIPPPKQSLFLFLEGLEAKDRSTPSERERFTPPGRSASSVQPPGSSATLRRGVGTPDAGRGH